MVSEAFQLTNPTLIRTEPRTRGKRKQTAVERLSRTPTAQPLRPAGLRPASGTAASWLGRFSRTDTRWMIQALQRLAAKLAEPTQEQLAALRAEEELAAIQTEADSGVAMATAEEIATLSERKLHLVDDRWADELTRLRKKLRKFQASARTSRLQMRESARKRAKLQSSWPGPTLLLEALEEWVPRFLGTPADESVVAGMLWEAMRGHEAMLLILAEHAMREAWTGQRPVSWLRAGEYYPAPDDALRPPKSYRPGRWRVRRAMPFAGGVVVPAGMVFQALPRESLPDAERVAVERTERGRRERADRQRWMFWAEVEDSLSDAQRHQLRERLTLWTEGGSLSERPMNPATMQRHLDAAKRDDPTADGEVSDKDWLTWIRWMERNLEKCGREGWRSWLQERAQDNGLRPPKPCRWLVCFRYPDDGPLRTAIPEVDVVALKGRDAAPRGTDREGEGPQLRLVPSPLPEPPPPEPAGILPVPVVVVDTETTGRSMVAEVCEIGAVLLDVQGNEVDRFCALARPQVLRGRAVLEALRFNGIQVRELQRARPIAEVAADFAAWLASHGNPVCLAYNASFDLRMLLRHGVVPTWGPCLMKLSKKVDPGKGGLEGLAERWGLLEAPQTHRALDDVRLTVSVLLETLRRLQRAAGTDPASAATLRDAHTHFVQGCPAQARALTRAQAALAKHRSGSQP